MGYTQPIPVPLVWQQAVQEVGVIRVMVSFCRSLALLHFLCLHGFPLPLLLLSVPVPAWDTHGHSPSGVSLLQGRFAMATVPQGFPCPSLGHPWLQYLRVVLALMWITHGLSPTRMYLPQCGSPMATVLGDVPAPVWGHSQPQCPQR